VSHLDTCRVCGRDPIPWDVLTFESVPLCELHENLARDAVRESMGRPTHETMFGTWVGIGAHDDNGHEFVRCSRDREHSSTSNAHPVGTLCRWCWANYVELLRNKREEILRRCEIEPDDARYRAELRRRRTLVEWGHEHGLITAEEGLRVMDLLVRPLRGESA
jgi:hypothetical protein